MRFIRTSRAMSARVELEVGGAKIVDHLRVSRLDALHRLAGAGAHVHHGALLGDVNDAPLRARPHPLLKLVNAHRSRTHHRSIRLIEGRPDARLSKAFNPAAGRRAILTRAEVSGSSAAAE